MSLCSLLTDSTSCIPFRLIEVCLTILTMKEFFDSFFRFSLLSWHLSSCYFDVMDKPSLFETPVERIAIGFEQSEVSRFYMIGSCDILVHEIRFNRDVYQ